MCFVFVQNMVRVVDFVKFFFCRSIFSHICFFGFVNCCGLLCDDSKEFSEEKCVRLSKENIKVASSLEAGFC